MTNRQALLIAAVSLAALAVGAAVALAVALAKHADMLEAWEYGA